MKPQRIQAEIVKTNGEEWNDVGGTLKEEETKNLPFKGIMI